MVQAVKNLYFYARRMWRIKGLQDKPKRREVRSPSRGTDKKDKMGKWLQDPDHNSWCSDFSHFFYRKVTLLATFRLSSLRGSLLSGRKKHFIVREKKRRILFRIVV